MERLDAMRPWVASLLGELVCTSSTGYRTRDAQGKAVKVYMTSEYKRPFLHVDTEKGSLRSLVNSPVRVQFD